MSRVHVNMPVSRFHDVLSWDMGVIGKMVDAAIAVAVKVGLKLDDDNEGTYLKEAERKGARVDWSERAVLFTRKDIESTIQVMRETLPISKAPRNLTISEAGREEKFGVGNGANLLFDWASWTAKAPDVSDLREVCFWAQGFDLVASLFPPFMLKDIDQRLEPIYNYAFLGAHCAKKIYHEQPTDPIHVKYLGRMARVVKNRRGYFQPMQEWEYVNPPFRISRRAVETMLARVDTGACTVMGIGPMSVAGLSAPVTVAGLAVTAVAEVLAGLSFFHILRPGFGLRANVCTGSLDLRTARVSYFDMHTHLCNLAAWEVLTRGIGVDCPCLTWYRDANEPGMQALYEFGMAQAFFSSVLQKSSPEIGGLASGNIFSPEQAVMDIEAIREFNELAFGFEADEEAMGLDDIASARFSQGHHTSTDHTLRHMPDGVPFSGFLFRGLGAGSRHDKDHTQTAELMEQAERTAREAKEKGRGMGLDRKLGAELYMFVEDAAKELGTEPPPRPWKGK